MATSNNKVKCDSCNKQKIVYHCQGCAQKFCFDCLAQHRKFLGQQLDEFHNDCDQFRQKIIEEKQDIQNHPLIKQIDRWEKESIEKIKQTAKDCRQLLIKHRNTNINEIETKLTKFAEQIRIISRETEFNETDLNLLKIELNKLEEDFQRPSDISLQQDDPTLFISQISIINVTKHKNPIRANVSQVSKIAVDVRARHFSPYITNKTRWSQNGVTIAGGLTQGEATHQFNRPNGIFVDKNQTIFVTDYDNHRIMKWEPNTKNGQVVAGGNQRGSRADQLNEPTDVIVDEETNSLIICDSENRRVVRWSLQSGTTNGEILIENITCNRLTMDDQRRLYISDYTKHEVRRYRIGETIGTLVAGGNGKGDGLNQLHLPTYVFIDNDYSLYVSDCYNHRVMKWAEGAQEGIVIAGGQGSGGNLSQLSHPLGVFVDRFSTVYVCDQTNYRIMRWCNEATEGEIIVGGNGKGTNANQLCFAQGLFFDQFGNLYVVDDGNHRIQRFSIETN